jgi:hypothetical protein
MPEHPQRTKGCEPSTAAKMDRCRFLPRTNSLTFQYKGPL